jgi:hypothetical protein
VIKPGGENKKLAELLSDLGSRRIRPKPGPGKKSKYIIYPSLKDSQFPNFIPQYHPTLPANLNIYFI